MKTRIARRAAIRRCGIAALFLLFSFQSGGPARGQETVPPGENYLFDECVDVAGGTIRNSVLTDSLVGFQWMYIMQYPYPTSDDAIGAIGSSGFDIVVMDPLYSSSTGELFSAAQVRSLKKGIGGAPAKEILAYLSVGEAEDFRDYFDDRWITGGFPNDRAPCWLNRPDPQLPGNYRVQYWSDEWQQVLLDAVDRILQAGYNGVVLDNIDAWEYWSDPENGEGYALRVNTAATRMIRLVKRIALYARAESPWKNQVFMVYQVNGERILGFDNRSGDYAAVISGLVVENLYDEGTGEGEARRNFIFPIADSGKKVLVVDYIDTGDYADAANRNRITRFINAAITDGLYPYVARREGTLDSINRFSFGGIRQPDIYWTYREDSEFQER